MPHRWIIKSLELIGINYKTVFLTKKDIRHWKTSMRLRTTEQFYKLNIEHEEHITNIKVSHLLYMNDLKLIGKTEDELQKQK